MTSLLNRRSFVRQAVGASVGLAAVPFIARGAARQLNIAAVGIGGKGHSDIQLVSKGQNVVALCDVDRQILERIGKEFPAARHYTDFREMLADRAIDAVTVSTPDHMHAPIAIQAMKAGKHVYCQKPLTHSVFEARRMAEVAAETGVVTQIGTQHHATSRFQTAVKAVREGKLGHVSHVHIWTDRPIWPQGMDRPAGSDPVPDYLDWDKWIGVAPERPFKEGAYHPFNWRGYWDFGTGAMGDMGCHFIDPAFTALDLTEPLSIVAEGPDPHPDTAPKWMIVRYHFAERDLTWYDGRKLPHAADLRWPSGEPLPENGIVFVGEKASLFINHEKGPLVLADAKSDLVLEAVPDYDHYLEWTNACLGQGKTSCPFAHAGPLTELVLLANVAYRSGQEIHWDRPHMRDRDSNDVAPFLRRQYRPGWQTEGL